jgi:hypothetical protein
VPARGAHPAGIATGNATLETAAPDWGYLAELAAALAGPGSPGPRPWPRSPSWPPGRAGLGLLATGRYLASVGRNSASSATSLPLGRAPTIRACSMPPVNTRRVGRLRMP